MKVKAAIIYPNNDVDPYFYYPHLGSLYIVSFLAQRGVDAQFSDFTVVSNWKKKVHEVLGSNPEVVGLSSNVTNYRNTNVLASYIKSVDKGVKIIVGGPHPTCSPQRYLVNKDIDAVCIGEGEHTFYEYMTRGNKADGLAVRNGGGVAWSKPRPLIDDLDGLPFPDLSQVDLKRYFHPFQKGTPMSSIITSRGCPCKCTFCFHDVHGFQWRARSPRNVVDEIKWQVNELGVRELAFWDDNLTNDLDRANKIFDMLIEEKVRLPMFPPNGIRSDRLTKDLLAKMQRAGLWLMVLAPDSGDPYILKRIQKGYTVEEIERAARWCKDLGFFLIIYFMIGFPFETREHVLNSFNLMKRLDPDIFLLNRYYPLPHTPIAEEYNLPVREGFDFKTAYLGSEFRKLESRIYLDFFANPRRINNLLKKVDKITFFASLFRYVQAGAKNFMRRNEYRL